MKKPAAQRKASKTSFPTRARTSIFKQSGTTFQIINWFVGVSGLRTILGKLSTRLTTFSME